MPNKDTDLLARLNALKPSSISLSQTSPSIDVEVSRPQSVEDRLADRVKRLRAQDDVSTVRTPQSIDESAAALTARVNDEVATEKDAIRDWQQQDGEEQSLDDLIAELDGLEPEWKLDPDDSKDVATLLQEAAAALPNDDEVPKTTYDTHAPQSTSEDNIISSTKSEDQQDTEEADEYVSRLLAELELEDKHDGKDDQGTESETAQNTDPFTKLNLPSTPSNLKQSITSDPPSYEDSELENRFTKLGMDLLPSTPTTKPSSSKPRIQATLKPPKNNNNNNLPQHTDAEMETWCCICNSDGEIRCLGCDGDIYCADCWNSGHGSRPGQERGHRAISYSAPPAGGSKRQETLG